MQVYQQVAEYFQSSASNDIIIARFVCKICCSLKWKTKNNSFLIMPWYLDIFNVFNKSTKNDHITTILSWLDRNHIFF